MIICDDATAQQYLMECIVQVFPDDFHLFTLQKFLQACCKLRAEVLVNQLIIALLNRLGKYSQLSRELLNQVDVFDIFFMNLKKILTVSFCIFSSIKIRNGNGIFLSVIIFVSVVRKTSLMGINQ